jgi:hypothetical protein
MSIVTVVLLLTFLQAPPLTDERLAAVPDAEVEIELSASFYVPYMFDHM